MDKVIKIIIGIIYSLILILLGWFAHAWMNRKEISQQIKQAIKDINEEHKKTLQTLRKEKDELIQALQEIIKNLQTIVNRLLDVLATKKERGEALENSSHATEKLSMQLRRERIKISAVESELKAQMK